MSMDAASSNLSSIELPKFCIYLLHVFELLFGFFQLRTTQIFIFCFHYCFDKLGLTFVIVLHPNSSIYKFILSTTHIFSRLPLLCPLPARKLQPPRSPMQVPEQRTLSPWGMTAICYLLNRHVLVLYVISFIF